MAEGKRQCGQRGWFGLGTPQANPTVEPEFRRMMPADTECFAVRLRSVSPDPRVRATEYLTELPTLVRGLATLNVDGFLFACTGSSCLVTAEQLAASGCPAVSSNSALVEAAVYLVGYGS